MKVLCLVLVSGWVRLSRPRNCLIHHLVMSGRWTRGSFLFDEVMMLIEVAGEVLKVLLGILIDKNVNFIAVSGRSDFSGRRLPSVKRLLVCVTRSHWDHLRNIWLLDNTRTLITLETRSMHALVLSAFPRSR